MDDLSRQWVERAEYDLDTADAMFKAVIVQRRSQLPPRIHRLARLAEVAGAPVNDKQVDFLRELSAYYIPTRYPEEVADIALEVKEDKARNVLDRSKEFMQWLNSISQ